MKSYRNPWFNFLLSDSYSNLALFLLRLFVGVVMLTHGIAKMQNYDTLKAVFMDPIGWGSNLSLIFIILVEVGCSLLVILGLMTRFAVLPLIFSMTIAAFFTASSISMSIIELPLIYLAIYVVTFVAGPGKYSVDYLLGKTFGKDYEE